MAKIITCASYYGSGSSAITDLMKEFDNICVGANDFEFRFIQDPYGICDLEYNLVLNNHRHNSGFAIKKFQKTVKILNGNRIFKNYNRFFGNEFKRLSDEYIKNLIDLDVKGFWHYDIIEKGKFWYYSNRIISKILSKFIHKKERTYFKIFSKERAYFSYPNEKFYDYTKQYIDNLFNILNHENKEFIMIDQLVPASNTAHYLKFFNNLKVIVVDRDPRDLYTLEKKVWKNTVIPCENPKDFCKWFILTRNHLIYEKNNHNIMRIKFEDLIYNYDKTVQEIINFLNLKVENHIYKQKFFDPNHSIKNTKVYLKYDDLEKDIQYIEQELSDYLYKK